VVTKDRNLLLPQTSTNTTSILIPSKSYMIVQASQMVLLAASVADAALTVKSLFISLVAKPSRGSMTFGDSTFNQICTKESRIARK
jgi:hypothetical protein